MIQDLCETAQPVPLQFDTFYPWLDLAGLSVFAATGAGATRRRLFGETPTTTRKRVLAMRSASHSRALCR